MGRLKYGNGASGTPVGVPKERGRGAGHICTISKGIRQYCCAYTYGSKSYNPRRYMYC